MTMSVAQTTQASRRARPERQQLSEFVSAHLREAIIVGEFPAESHIRTEHIAGNLGVSATPVREALMILQSEGIVSWEARGGFKVVRITLQDIEDLFKVQAFIAGELAAKATRLIQPSSIAELRSLQSELEEAARIGDVSAVDSLNHYIHRTVNLLPNARRLTPLLNTTVHYVPLKYFGNIKGWAEASSHDHEPIFVALEQGDPEIARSAMGAHINHIGQLLTEHLKGEGVLP
jgi:DNA-binding GntR family transcriptional regulator